MEKKETRIKSEKGANEKTWEERWKYLTKKKADKIGRKQKQRCNIKKGKEKRERRKNAKQKFNFNAT